MSRQLDLERRACHPQCGDVRSRPHAGERLLGSCSKPHLGRGPIYPAGPVSGKKASQQNFTSLKINKHRGISRASIYQAHGLEKGFRMEKRKANSTQTDILSLYGTGLSEEPQQCHRCTNWFQFPRRRQFGKRPSVRLPNTSDSEYVSEDLVRLLLASPSTHLQRSCIHHNRGTENKTNPALLKNQSVSKQKEKGELALAWWFSIEPRRRASVIRHCLY